MINLGNTLNKAVNGVEDFLTPSSVKAQRTFKRAPKPVATPPFQFTRPTTQKEVTQGQNNATNSATQPKGTVFGSNLVGTPQARALNIKGK